MEENKVKLAVMANDIEHIKLDLDEIKKLFKDLKKNYVTRAEFEPVKKLVYGLVALILIAVAGAVIGLVVL